MWENEIKYKIESLKKEIIKIKAQSKNHIPSLREQLLQIIFIPEIALKHNQASELIKSKPKIPTHHLQPRNSQRSRKKISRKQTKRKENSNSQPRHDSNVSSTLLKKKN